MIVGIPKEIKNNENRVGMTPAGVNELVKHGHTVYVQKGAGENSGFPDSSYERVGAKILATIEDVYAISEMIVKVKEPIAPEYPLIRKGQLLFTYFHFASDRRLTEAMMSSGATCLAYETVELKDHSLPLLIPMSEVAGRMATQEGARFLERPQGGKGKLMGGVPGVKPAKVLVIGAGVVGYSAARIAAGMGADVTITDLSLSRLRHIDEIKPANIKTLYSSEFNSGCCVDSGCESPSFDHERYAVHNGKGFCIGRCGYRSGRLFRDFSSDDALRTGLRSRWYNTLLCSQYSRCCFCDFDIGFDKCYAPLCGSISR